MQYPEGYSAKGPHCGVLSVAVCAEVSFDRAWLLIKKIKKPRGLWKGSTFESDREQALWALGVKFAKTTVLKPNVRFREFVANHAQPGFVYMVRMPGHVVTYKDGMLLDQSGLKPYRQHSAASKTVLSFIKIGVQGSGGFIFA